MKILHVITGLGDGGAEAVLYRTCLQGRGDTHVVVSLRDAGKYGPLLEAIGTKTHCLNMHAGVLRVTSLFRLWRLIRSVDPDAVQTWMYHGDLFGGVVARLAGCPAVCWGVHNTTLPRGSSSRLTAWIARLNAVLSHWVPRRIIYCAQEAQRVHQALGYDPRRAVVIPNGYDIGTFQPDDAARSLLRKEWLGAEEWPVIGMVARLHPQKDHDNLLSAVRILGDRGVALRCVLVGAGMETGNPEIRGLLARHGLDGDATVIPLGQRKDVPAIMNAIDVHVLSSVGEAFPNVLCEAMACGTPCVTTDVGDAALIVAKTGWVVPPRQAPALADAIEHALRERATMPRAWRERQQCARARIVEQFDVVTMYAAYRRQWSN